MTSLFGGKSFPLYSGLTYSFRVIPVFRGTIRCIVMTKQFLKYCGPFYLEGRKSREGLLDKIL